MNKTHLTDLLRSRDFKKLFNELGWDDETPSSPISFELPDPCPEGGGGGGG